MSVPKGSEVEAQAQSDGAAPTPTPKPCPGGDVPREGSRDIHQRGRIISVPYDWCKSMDSPVAYRIWAWQSSASNLANTVRQTDCRSHVMGSIVNECYGDEPGQGGGVESGTHLAECTPMTASPTVRAEGKPMVRFLDKWWMNHKNTWGCLNNSEDMGKYDAPKVRTIDEKMYVADASGTMAIPQGSAPSQASTPPSASQSIQNFAKKSIGTNPIATEMNMIQQLPQVMQDSMQRSTTMPVYNSEEEAQARQEGFRNLDEKFRYLKSMAKKYEESKAANGTLRVTGVKKLKCYNMNKFLSNKPKEDRGYYIKEYCRQLRLQEEALNNTTVDDFNKAQQNYDNNGRLNDQGSFKADLTPGYVKQLMSEGWSQSDAEDMARNAAALHNPDQRWGNSVVNALGDRNVNSSIGGGAPSRVSDFKNHLSDTKPDGNSKLQIKLCAEYNGKEAC